MQIAFLFNSSNVTGSGDYGYGWYIDEVSLETGDIVFNNPEDWEDGLGDWYVETGTWETGTPSSGPGSAHEGLRCAATVLAGYYSESSHTSRLVSPVFTVPAEGENPRLGFWHWFSFSSGDYGVVQI